jgi:hypothetical protein
MGEPLRDALEAMRTWLGVVADHLDLDPDMTRITINAVGPDGKREVAARSLRSILEQADAALFAPSGDGGKG